MKKTKAILVEVCFCDNSNDVRMYQEAGGESAIAEAIYAAIQKKVENDSIPFDEYVGTIAL